MLTSEGTCNLNVFIDCIDTNDMNRLLMVSFIRIDDKNAIKQMNPIKSPSLNGMLALFY